MDNETEPIVDVDPDWHPSFVFLPHRTVGNKWVWGKCYKRIVWRYTGTGFHTEPFREYGTLFDVLMQS